MSTTKPRYRTPTTYREVEVSLDDFDDEEVAGYLRHRGYSVSGGSAPEELGGDPIEGEGPVVIDEDDLSRCATLALCGQKGPARDVVLEIVERRIGRSLR